MGNGGGIYSDGPLRVKYSEVSGNIVSETGADGGGIAASGATLYIGSTMISGNTAVDNGGGVYSDSPTDTTIRQSTLSGNNTTSGSGDGGGIYLRYSTGPHLIHNSTITGNTAGDDGGGIYNYGNITPANRLSLQNSTVAGNIATTRRGPVCQLRAGPPELHLGRQQAAGGPDASGFVSADFSLIENPAGATIGTVTVGSNITGADPQLARSPTTEGRGTLTRILYQTSPALDQGKNIGFPWDQRSTLFPRPLTCRPSRIAGGGRRRLRHGRARGADAAPTSAVPARHLDPAGRDDAADDAGAAEEEVQEGPEAEEGQVRQEEEEEALGQREGLARRV